MMGQEHSAVQGVMSRRRSACHWVDAGDKQRMMDGGRLKTTMQPAANIHCGGGRKC